MKQTKPKSNRICLAQQFKQKCKQTLKQEPRSYLLSSMKDDDHLNLDLTLFTLEDMPFFQVMLTLPLRKITVSTPNPNSQKSPTKNKNKDPQTLQIKSFFQTPKFRDFMVQISLAIETKTSLKSVKIQRVPLSVKALQQLNEGIVKTTSLRELGLISCGLTEQHLQQIKVALAENKTLMTLDLSSNCLCEVGGMVGKILSQHARRRNQIVFFLNIRGQSPADDLSNSGLCELNLQNNQLTDRSVTQMTQFLKGDGWTKCLNLRNNLIKLEGVKQLALMLKNNTSLISLDLRGNEGLTRQYSRYIYKKLVLNMEKYKAQRQFFQKTRPPSNIPEANEKTPSKAEQFRRNQEDSAVKYKSVRDSSNYFGRYDSKQYTTNAAEPQRQGEKNNMTLDSKIKVNSHEGKIVQLECHSCKKKTFQMLRLEKKNLDLQLQLRKVKHALLTKNIDISAILPSCSSTSQNQLNQWLSNKSNQNDDQLLQRMEQIMMELTRVIETIEEHQNTNVHMSNPLDNPNSFSNTVHLYDNKNSQLQDLSKEIEEDRLQAMFQGGSLLGQKIQEN